MFQDAIVGPKDKVEQEVELDFSDEIDADMN
jgi:hypothetical protein